MAIHFLGLKLHLLWVCVCVRLTHQQKLSGQHVPLGVKVEHGSSCDPQGGGVKFVLICLCLIPFPPTNPAWVGEIFHSPSPITANKSPPLWLSVIRAAHRDKRTPGGVPELYVTPPLCLPQRCCIKDICSCHKQWQRQKVFNALFKVRHRINSVTLQCCLLSSCARPENLQVAMDFDIHGDEEK